MSSFKGILAVAILTAIVAWGALQLNVGEYHRDPLWALGTSVAFLTLLITNVWLFFAIAKDEPFKWE